MGTRGKGRSKRLASERNVALGGSENATRGAVADRKNGTGVSTGTLVRTALLCYFTRFFQFDKIFSLYFLKFWQLFVDSRRCNRYRRRAAEGKDA